MSIPDPTSTTIKWPVHEAQYNHVRDEARLVPICEIVLTEVRETFFIGIEPIGSTTWEHLEHYLRSMCMGTAGSFHRAFGAAMTEYRRRLAVLDAEAE